MIFKCEADWAYAMNLKQRGSQKQAKINPNRARVHSLKRFKAASDTSGRLFADSLDSLS